MYLKTYATVDRQGQIRCLDRTESTVLKLYKTLEELFNSTQLADQKVYELLPLSEAVLSALRSKLLEDKKAEERKEDEAEYERLKLKLGK